MKSIIILLALIANSSFANDLVATVEDTAGPIPPALPTTIEEAPLVHEALAEMREVFDINDVKPSGGDDLATAKAKCQELSAIARANTTKTLVIAFEGFASYDGSGTREAYRYHHALVNRQDPGEAPSRGLGGFVLHGLMLPLIKKHKGGIEFLVFPQQSISGNGTSVAEACARVWMANPRKEPDLAGRRLIIIGHSYGGHSANQLASALHEAQPVRVDSVLTMDARTKFYVGGLERPANVRRWENYKHSGGISLRGYNVDGADLNASITGASHTSLPWAPPIHAAANRLILGR